MQPAADKERGLISKMLDTDPPDYLLPCATVLLMAFTMIDYHADKNKKIDQLAQACRANMTTLQAQDGQESNGLVLLNEEGEPFICQLSEGALLFSRPTTMHRAPLVAPEKTGVLDSMKQWFLKLMNKAHLPIQLSPHQPAAPERRP